MGLSGQWHLLLVSFMVSYVTDSNSILRCRCALGSMPSKCRQELPYYDVAKAKENAENAKANAGVYVSIILSIYVIGLLVLLLHHVKQKHGQVTLA